VIEVKIGEKPGSYLACYIPLFSHDKLDLGKSFYWFAYNINNQGISPDPENNESQGPLIRHLEAFHFPKRS